MTWYFYEIGNDYGHSPMRRGEIHRSATLKNALARAYQMVKYKYAEEVLVTDDLDKIKIRYNKYGDYKAYNVPYIVYDDSPYNKPMSLYVVRTKKGIKRLMADGSMRELK